MQKHVVTLKDLSPEQLRAAVEDAERFRGERRSDLLAGHTVVLVFFNPSLRTRVSMELAGKHLGAEVVTVNVGTDVWRLEHRDGAVMNEDRAEHIKDAVRVLSRYGDVVGVRAFPGRRSWEEDREDPIVRGFARWADVPVLNLESSLYHPCQGLADVITIQRALGPDPGKIVLAWTDHPKALPVAVPDSFATAVTRMGWDLTIAHPRGYDLPTEVVAACRAQAAQHGRKVTITHDLAEGLEGAKIVYAKSWGRIDRYGQTERELGERAEQNLSAWTIDEGAMAKTDEAGFMHCLPVRRNVVVSDGVIDGPRSLVYDQAENRMHGQKALLRYMLR
ncbi:MAG: N-acetylornithine carbamoyltransferase [Planctomycetota bacterium]|jgi:N-acetylornithine carbamoyltransferase